jgi:hypothetical protein
VEEKSSRRLPLTPAKNVGFKDRPRPLPAGVEGFPFMQIFSTGCRFGCMIQILFVIYIFLKMRYIIGTVTERAGMKIVEVKQYKILEKKDLE